MSQVPDMPGSGLVLHRHGVYKGAGCKVEKGAVCREGVVLGPGSKVGAGARLEHCSLGPGARVGEDCQLERCVVMQGAVVGRGVRLAQVVLGAGVVVEEGAVVGARCLLGEGVVVPAGVVVKEGSRLSASLEDDWGEEGESDSKLGPKAFLYTDEDEEEDEDEDEGDIKDVKDWWGSAYEVPEDSDSEASSVEGSDFGDESDDQDQDEEQEDEQSGNEHDDVKNFRREVMESIERGGNTDNLVLEINGSKHAWNITLSEVGLTEDCYDDDPPYEVGCIYQWQQILLDMVL